MMVAVPARPRIVDCARVISRPGCVVHDCDRTTVRVWLRVVGICHRNIAWPDPSRLIALVPWLIVRPVASWTSAAISCDQHDPSRAGLPAKGIDIVNWVVGNVIVEVNPPVKPHRVVAEESAEVRVEIPRPVEQQSSFRVNLTSGVLKWVSECTDGKL